MTDTWNCSVCLPVVLGDKNSKNPSGQAGDGCWRGARLKGPGRGRLYPLCTLPIGSLDEASALSPGHCCTVLLLGCSLVLDNPWVGLAIDDPR